MTDFASISDRLVEQAIELPSWAFGNSGTRFRVFTTPGVPRTPFEKVSDAAQVNKHTALAPSVALHIPWDKVEDYGKLAEFARSMGSLSGRSTRTRSRTTTTSWAVSATRTRRCGARRSVICWSASTSWTPPARPI